MVEDIGPSMIDLLGSTFHISPEFFVEHLHRSGYTGGKENDLPPQMWSTSSMEKNYISLKWYRPVTRWNQEPNSPEQRKTLLGSRYQTDGILTGSKEVEHTSKNKLGTMSTVEYSIRTRTNIFRPEWAMSTDPDGVIPPIASAGWEERATACAIYCDGVRYGSFVSLSSFL